MNAILGFLKKPQSSPPPASTTKLSQEEFDYLLEHYKWLKLPLDPEFAIRDSSEFIETAHWLLNAAQRGGKINDVVALAGLLVRRIIFTHYYHCYHNPQWRQEIATSTRTVAEQKIAQIDCRALDLARNWIQSDFSVYGVRLASDPKSPVEWRVDTDEICNQVWKEVCDRGLLPKIVLPQQPAPSPAVATPQSQPVQPVQQYVQQQLLQQPPSQPAPIQPAVQQPATPPQSPAPVIATKPGGEEIMRQTQIKPEQGLPSVEFAGGNLLHKYGLLFAKLISEKIGKGGGLTYLPQESAGSEIYYGQLVFQMDPKMDVQEISDRVMQHALSWAELDPDTGTYQVRLLKGGKVAIDLPIYTGENWKRSHFIFYIGQECNAMSQLKADTILDFLKLTATALRDMILLPGGHLQVLAGIQPTGDPILCKLLDRSESGVMIAGRSGCGKTGLMIAILTQLCIAFPPTELQVAIADVKGSAQTFHLANNLPHYWMPPTQAEWSNQVRSHQLRLTPEQQKALWSEQDVALTSVVSQGADAIALFNALEREGQRRTAIFQHYGLTSFFEYNDLARSDRGRKLNLPVMPFLPIFVDATMALANAIGPKNTQNWLATIASQWRDYGMPLIECVPDDRASVLMPSNTPLDVATKVLFLSSRATVTRALGERETDRRAAIPAVERLRKHADAIAFSGGSVAHVQPFFVPSANLEWVVKALTLQHKQWVDDRDLRRLTTTTTTLPEISNPPLLPDFDPLDDDFDEQGGDTVEEEILIEVSADRDHERFQKLMAYFEKNEQAMSDTGKRCISTNTVLREVIGAYEYDDKEKVLNGGSRQRGIQRLIDLAARHGVTLVDQEIRDMQRRRSRFKVV